MPYLLRCPTSPHAAAVAMMCTRTYGPCTTSLVTLLPPAVGPCPKVSSVAGDSDAPCSCRMPDSGFPGDVSRMTVTRSQLEVLFRQHDVDNSGWISKVPGTALRSSGGQGLRRSRQSHPYDMCTTPHPNPRAGGGRGGGVNRAAQNCGGVGGGGWEKGSMDRTINQ